MIALVSCGREIPSRQRLGIVGEIPRQELNLGLVVPSDHVESVKLSLVNPGFKYRCNVRGNISNIHAEMSIHL